MESFPEPVAAGADWLAAVLAPWAIAPHPNFTTQNISGPAQLALVADYRDDEFDRDDVETENGRERWVAELVKAARESLFSETFASATEILTALAVSHELPGGARAAAALYASNALADYDDLESAIETIQRCLEIFSATGVKVAPSTALSVCALRLQSAMRWWELGDLENVKHDLDAFDVAARACPPGADFEDFEVSPGISWGASLVQADISKALAGRAMQLRSRSEGLRGNLWQQLVRRRPNWVDVRIDWTNAERDRKIVKAAFDLKNPASLSRIVLSGEVVPGAVSGYAAMWQAELGGDLGESLQCRESLAQLLLLEREKFGANDAIREALHLMRRSSSRDGLRTAISIARSEGPVDALAAALAEVVRRPSFPKRLSAQDIRLIEGAVDLLEEADVRRVLEGLVSYLRADDDRNTKTIRDPSIPLGVLANLAKRFPVLGEQIAAEVFDLFETTDISLLRVEREVVRIANSIDWQQVGQRLRNRWIKWARALSADESLRDLTESLRIVLDPEPDTSSIVVDSVSKLVRLINTPSAAWTSNQTSSAVVLVRGEINQAIAEATSGVRTFGVWDGPGLASLVALNTSDVTLWLTLAAFLAREDVEADMKSEALQRLADRPLDVPDFVATEFRNAWPVLSAQRPVDPPLSSDRSSYFPAALRFGARFQLESASYFISAATAMAADRDLRARQHAALVCRDVLESFDAVTWGHAMLLNLSRDDDFNVRTDACRMLVETSIRASEIRGVVDSRVEELLCDDSIRTPLATLHGFQVLATVIGGVEGFRTHETSIRQLAETHPSSTVRGAAESAIAAHLADNI